MLTVIHKNLMMKYIQVTAEQKRKCCLPQRAVMEPLPSPDFRNTSEEFLFKTSLTIRNLT
jgi:hypothetical protein